MTTQPKTEGYAIRYHSLECIKDKEGYDIPKEMGYVRSPSLYPEPLAKAIVHLLPTTEYGYFISWMPNFETIDKYVQKIGLSYQSIDWTVLEKLPKVIGEICEPVIGWIVKDLTAVDLEPGFYGHGTMVGNLSEVKWCNNNRPEIQHFLIDKSWN